MSITLSVDKEILEVAEYSYLKHAVRTRTHRHKEIRRSIRTALSDFLEAVRVSLWVLI